MTRVTGMTVDFIESASGDLPHTTVRGVPALDPAAFSEGFCPNCPGTALAGPAGNWCPKCRASWLPVAGG